MRTLHFGKIPKLIDATNRHSTADYVQEASRCLQRVRHSKLVTLLSDIN